MKTPAASYGQPPAALPPLNENEVELIRRAIGTAIFLKRDRADECGPGSTGRSRLEAEADQLSRIGRKLAFPSNPEQW